MGTMKRCCIIERQAEYSRKLMFWMLYVVSYWNRTKTKLKLPIQHWIRLTRDLKQWAVFNWTSKVEAVSCAANFLIISSNGFVNYEVGTRYKSFFLIRLSRFTYVHKNTCIGIMFNSKQRPTISQTLYTLKKLSVEIILSLKAF